MRDAVESCFPFIVGSDEMPGGVLGVGRLQHHISSSRVLIPPPVGLDVHRAKLPLTERVFNARKKTTILLLHSNFQPIFDENDSTIYHYLFDRRTAIKKTTMLFFAAEAHHIFHARAVVPTSVKNHDFAGSGKVLHVTLKIHLSLLTIGRGG